VLHEELAAPLFAPGLGLTPVHSFPAPLLCFALPSPSHARPTPSSFPPCRHAVRPPVQATPSKTFDLLAADFNHAFLLLLLGGLGLAVVLMQRWDRKKKLGAAWQ